MIRSFVLFIAAACVALIWIACRQATTRQQAVPHVAAPPASTAADAVPAILARRDGVLIASFTGDAEHIGRASGQLLAPQLRTLLATALHMPGVAALRQQRLAELRAQVDEATATELDAVAAAADVSARDLYAANLATMTLCSAVVRVGAPVSAASAAPLQIARNLDYHPAALLAAGTVVQVWRRSGVRPLAVVGWPGHQGVISGMNDAGVTACVLLRLDAAPQGAGVPLALRLRRILEQASDLGDALRLFAAVRCMEPHFVLFADARDARVAFWDAAGMQQRAPQDGFLRCSNSGGAADPDDARGRHLRALCATAPTTRGDASDALWLRRTIAASFLPDMNAQAMLLVPELRRLDLALATLTTPACAAPWVRIDVAALLAGEDPHRIAVTTLGRTNDPAPHYSAVRR